MYRHLLRFLSASILQTDLHMSLKCRTHPNSVSEVCSHCTQHITGCLVTRISLFKGDDTVHIDMHILTAASFDKLVCTQIGRLNFRWEEIIYALHPFKAS